MNTCKGKCCSIETIPYKTSKQNVKRCKICHYAIETHDLKCKCCKSILRTRTDNQAKKIPMVIRI